MEKQRKNLKLMNWKINDIKNKKKKKCINHETNKVEAYLKKSIQFEKKIKLNTKYFNVQLTAAHCTTHHKLKKLNLCKEINFLTIICEVHHLYHNVR